MIPEIKKILYATDLSNNARHAFGYAAGIANRYGAQIAILHVLEEISHSATIRLATLLGEDRWQDLQNRNVQDVIDTIKTRLDTFCEDMQAQLDKCPFLVDDIIVKLGEPVEIILEQADEVGADLVIMGTHGHGILEDATLGSTAGRVVRRSLKPVLTVHLPK